MHDMADDALARLYGKLSRLSELSASDKDLVDNIPYRITQAGGSAYLVREGAKPTECCLLVSGYACRHKSTHNGGRQIVSFQLPGDLLDLQNMHLGVADHNVQTITPATIAWIPYAALRDISQQSAAISDALWRDALIDASIFREWVLNVGRRDAKQRVAHLLCEFAARSEAAGLGLAERFILPMSQEHIADATGLTPVHVNRMLRVLADDGLIARETARDIRIVDWSRMRRFADFQPGYLHQAA